MTALIIYDSQFGNTEKIAKAIGQGISEAKILRANEAKPTDLESLDLLIVGSPTQGGRATQSVQNFINSIPADGLRNIRVAAFDTRFAEKQVNFALRLLIKTIGYAAAKIGKLLEAKGGQTAMPPEGFIVTGKEGPLKDGELERATEWGKKMVY